MLFVTFYWTPGIRITANRSVGKDFIIIVVILLYENELANHFSFGYASRHKK